MSDTIDKRIVEMQFDNKQFEQGTKTSMDTIGQLKKALNFDREAKGFSGLTDAARGVNLNSISDGLQGISNKFSAMGIIGITTLMNLTNAAVNYGKRIFTSLTVDPINLGLKEYETLLNSIQTTLANTQSKGTTLDQVNKALDELNAYSDKTIYNFAQMARNIGTFTAAGVSLETSVMSIKGIANLAALSGSNAEQASTAMYQLSQAISSGTVRLMDWNSVVNAGMGGQVFQDALIETARVNGVAVDEMIAKNGSFRNSLQENWLSAEIMTQTLAKFTGDLSKEQLISMGYTDQQADKIVKMGVTATDAATKVKTFTQLFDTLKETAQSGWAQTWRTILGDFEEAKAFFTELNNKFGAILGASADARNNLLLSWKNMGGRKQLLEVVRNSLEAIERVLKPVSEAFREIFPPITALQLLKFSHDLRILTDRLKISGETADKLKRIFKGVFAIFDILKMAISAIAKGLSKLIAPLGIAGGGFLDILANIGDFVLKLRDAVKASDIFGRIIGTIGDVLSVVAGSFALFIHGISKAISAFSGTSKVKGFLAGISEAFKTFFSSFKDLDLNVLDGFIERLKERFGFLSNIGAFLSKAFEKKEALTPNPMEEKLKKIGDSIKAAIVKFFTGIIDFLAKIDFSEIKFNSILDGINAGLLGTLLLAITKFVNQGTNLFGGILDIFKGITGFAASATEILGGIRGILDGVRGSLEAWQQSVRAKVISQIAIAVAILAGSLLVLSLIDSEKLTMALVAVSTLFANLFATMMSYDKLIGPGGGLKTMTTGVVGMLGMAAAVLILSGALMMLSKIDAKDMAKGIVSIGILSALLIATSRAMSTNLIDITKGAISMIIFSIALGTLVKPVKKLAELDPAALARGLVGIGVLMTELSIFMRSLDLKATAIDDAIALFILASSIGNIAGVVERFAKVDTANLTQGLVVMAVILTELTLFSRMANGNKGFIEASIGAAILAGALRILADVLVIVGSMSWESLIRGLIGIGGALAIIAVATTSMPPNMLSSSVALLVIAGALVVMSQALGNMGSMSWEQLAVGLVALGGSLLILSVAMNSMTAALPGAAALLVAAAALAIIAPTLKLLGTMSIAQIGIALLALAGAFIILGVAGAVLTPVIPTLLGLAGAMAMLGVGALAVGLGIMAFAAGMATLAVSGAAGAAAMAVIITTLVSLLPLIATSVAKALISFAKAITEGVPAFYKAATTLLFGFIMAVMDNIPEMVDAVLTFVETLLTSLSEKLPSIIQAGYDIILSLLKGIRDNIGEIVKVTYDIVTEFLDAVSAKLPQIIDSGFTLIKAWIDGMTEAVEEHLPDLVRSVQKLGLAIIKGLVQGLADGRSEVLEQIKDIARIALQEFKEVFGIQSPSKVMAEVGQYIVLGLTNGLSKYGSSATNAAGTLADQTVASFSSVVSRITDALNSGLDMNPTIRPVLDLSDIQAGGKSIDQMLANKSLNLSSINNRLASVTQSQAKVVGPEMDKAAQINPGTTVTFTQNNYSPKELSRIDIYRQTKNQLLQAKRMVGI